MISTKSNCTIILGSIDSWEWHRPLPVLSLQHTPPEQLKPAISNFWIQISPTVIHQMDELSPALWVASWQDRISQQVPIAFFIFCFFDAPSLKLFVNYALNAVGPSEPVSHSNLFWIQNPATRKMCVYKAGCVVVGSLGDDDERHAISVACSGYLYALALLYNGNRCFPGWWLLWNMHPMDFGWGIYVYI